jgi:hypothetical protein
VRPALRFESFLDGGDVVRRIVRLAEEHGTPNGFLAQEVTTRFANAGTVGRIHRTDGAGELLAAYGLTVKARATRGFTVEQLPKGGVS